MAPPVCKDWAQQLGKPVELWRSDKQDAFVKGIQAELPDTPHRHCHNHFLRDLAKLADQLEGALQRQDGVEAMVADVQAA